MQNDTLRNPERENEGSDLERLMRIAEGREELERMARAETDPVRRDALFASWGEAVCVS